MAEVSPTISPRRRELESGIPEPRMRPPRELVAARVPTTPLETLRFADARGGSARRQPARSCAASTK